jgi:hypothetical protein
MRIKKLQEFEQPILEAQNWPTGSIAKVTSKLNLGKESYGWSTFTPDQAAGAEGGVFYMKITHSGRKWMEGPIIAGNCLKNVDFSKARADKAVLETPGPEYSIFVKDKIFEKGILGKSFFLDGNETGMIDMAGNSKSISEGEYIAKSLNFKLTAEQKETVVYMVSKTRNEWFNATLSDLEGFSKELSKDQKEVIAEWFAKELGGAQIDVDDKFRISQWYVKASSSKGYPSTFSAGPFVNEKQAKEIMEATNKLNKYSLFDPEQAKVETTWSKIDLTLDQLIDWCRTVGVKTTMKELLALRKGAVAAKKFGV